MQLVWTVDVKATCNVNLCTEKERIDRLMSSARIHCMQISPPSSLHYQLHRYKGVSLFSNLNARSFVETRMRTSVKGKAFNYNEDIGIVKDYILDLLTTGANT